MKQNGALYSSHAKNPSGSESTTEDAETVKDSIETLLASSGEYLETRIDLFKLKSIDKASEMVSTVASGLIVAVAFLMFGILINIGIALLLGDWMGEAYYGFLTLAAIYLITALIFKSNAKKWFKEPIADSFIKKFF